MTFPRAVALAGACALLAGCDFREYVIDQTVREQVSYVPDVKHYSGYELTKLGEHTWSFRWTWLRSLVVRTDEGFVVTDPYSAEAAAALKAELAKLAPGVPVRLMIYSHYHLDHVVGAAPLQPMEIVAHQKCPASWQAVGGYRGVKDIVPPTRLIDGDQSLTIGGVKLELLYLGRSHTDTLYAFYVPGDRVLHTVDVGLVRTLYPIGGPDMFMPGMISAMERLAALDFEHWVPAHYDLGTKQDFKDALGLATDLRDLANAAYAKYGVPGDEDGFAEAFHSIYDPFKQKYGAYRGFNQQGLFVVSRAYSGAVLGY